MTRLGGAARDRPAGAPRGTPWLRRARIVAGVVIPVSAYVMLAAALHSDTYALAITETAGVAWVLVIGLRQGRLNPIAVATAVVLVVALALTVASGGSALPLKLRRGVITGSLGVACLASVIVRRPLLPTLLRVLGRGAPERAGAPLRALHRAIPDAKAIGLTAIVGLALVTDALTQVTLALTVSTTVFVGASRLARLAVSAIGIAAYALYWRAGRGREPASATASEPANEEAR